jgi:hypothetical protein
MLCMLLRSCTKTVTSCGSWPFFKLLLLLLLLLLCRETRTLLLPPPALQNHPLQRIQPATSSSSIQHIACPGHPA